MSGRPCHANPAIATLTLAVALLGGCQAGSQPGRPTGHTSGAPASLPANVDPIPLTSGDCLRRRPSAVKVIAGDVAGSFRDDAPTDGTTIDARTASFRDDGKVGTAGTAMIYPLLLGKKQPAQGVCVVGGSVSGTLDRSMTWPQLKAEVPQRDGRRVYFDAAALTEFARGDGTHLVDGLRVDNVADGVAARGSFQARRALPLDGGGFGLRDAYFTFVHDDCVDVNDLGAGIVFDSLLDGCYTGFSERPDSKSPLLSYHQPRGSNLVVDHVLVRMTPFPGPHPTAHCRAGTAAGYNEMFKWSPNANPPVVQDSVFLLEAAPCSTRYFPFPKHSTLSRVTIVWAGHGRWRWGRPRGVRITSDRRVWDRARTDWLQRHGCTSVAAGLASTTNVCLRLTEPSSLPKT